MILRIVSKTVFPVLVAGAVLTLLSNDASAWDWGGWGGGWGGNSDGCSCGGGGGSVPEIGAGSAASALGLLTGGIYMLKDRFLAARSNKTDA
jgi:hypothetical protein